MMTIPLLAAIDFTRLFPKSDPQSAPTAIGTFVLASIIKMLVVFGVVMLGVALLTWLERKVAAWIQDRRGPNRLGPWGLLQPVADGIKNFMKEETSPGEADRWLFLIAPALSFIPAMLTWAVIPLAAPLPTPWGLIDMSVANLPVGYLFTLAISSLGVYGIVLAGWSSNNKYALLGGLRSSAQMISYEIAMGMSTIPILLLAGNVSLTAIIQQQSHMGWNVLSLTVAWFTFLVAAFAETNRLPFDLPEAESELVAGFMVEYSSTPYLLFMAGEYIAIFLMCALMSLLFFGGWLSPIPGLADGWWWMVGKMWVFFFLFAMVKAIVPRYRYDQLMRIGWKVFLPLSLGWVVIVSFLAKFEVFGGFWARWAIGG